MATRVSAAQGNPVVASQEGHSDDNLRNLLLEILRRVHGPGQGPVTRRATIKVLHDLGRNIANAYHWHHLLLAVRRDGAVDPATETAIRECIRAINGGAPAKQPRPRRAEEIRRAWNGPASALVM